MSNLQRFGVTLLNPAKNSVFRRNVIAQESLRLNSDEATQKTVSKEDLSEAEKRLTEEVETLAKEANAIKERTLELEDKYKRALAESENMRRRLTKQIEDAKIFGIQSFCKDLLEVADILAKATEVVPESELVSNLPLKNLYQGLKMTEKQLQAVFRRNGLTQINPVGEMFDPNQHEALFQQPNTGKKSGTVVVVSKIGYKLKDRTVRPACVGVAQ
ncbi:grpE protein homolog, mitochondrial-like [Artemia franciscana]|uniref:GrpE protein homolog n=1 Tax=Artemia franciscana TaxID=6661 RepID=A0AA88L0Z1_ARTSF|nr:hypothetical protein QYM36_011180 [Artemia franciscana]